MVERSLAKSTLTEVRNIVIQNIAAGAAYFSVLGLVYGGYSFLKGPEDFLQLSYGNCDQHFILNQLKSNSDKNSLDVLLKSGVRNIEVRTRDFDLLPAAEQYVQDSKNKYARYVPESTISVNFSGSRGYTGQVTNYTSCEVLVIFEDEQVY